MKKRAFFILALVLLICSTKAFANWWIPLMAMDTGNAMNKIERVANEFTQVDLDDPQELFSSMLSVYYLAKQLEVRFPYDASQDQDFRFQPSFTPIGQTPSVNWAELEKANVRTAIDALWNVAINVQLTAKQALHDGRTKISIFVRLSNLYFQMKRAGS